MATPTLLTDTEIIKAKYEAETLIEAALAKFQERTGKIVSDLKFNREEIFIEGNKKPVDSNLSVEIEILKP